MSIQRFYILQIMETYRAAEWKNAVCVNGVHKKIQIKFLPIPNLWTVVYTVYKLYQLPAKKTIQKSLAFSK